ncbi:tyrosinase family protein [Noviherbaspirillum soli]|uniref:tyrosinase family protein n=1 Tax=Noviherbaspirillum soli TaxID=1064518 RepID=UPI00188C61A3|nr:tyrosinase family protein [Noviherbaspirillum soli]
MASAIISRRSFIKDAAPLAAVITVPRLGLAHTIGMRLEWQEFKQSEHYGNFINGIRAMRANSKQTNAASWRYWVNVHVNYCPHGIAYFLAWHRGYLFHFERQLRLASGDPQMVLPYWNYYKDPRIPPEFLDSAGNNPLYVQRAGTSVYNALDLSPFASTVYNFQRGTSNAFETRIESAPHNPVHNLIGNQMATMQSPLDPTFYLHHANIDRLWHAWSLPSGKGTPYTTNPYSSSSSNPYWSGSFTYAPGLSLPRYQAYTPSWLGTSSSNNTMPSSLPPQAQAQATPLKLVQAQMDNILNRPPATPFAATAGR